MAVHLNDSDVVAALRSLEELVNGTNEVGVALTQEAIDSTVVEARALWELLGELAPPREFFTHTGLPEGNEAESRYMLKTEGFSTADSRDAFLDFSFELCRLAELYGYSFFGGSFTEIGRNFGGFSDLLFDLYSYLESWDSENSFFMESAPAPRSAVEILKDRPKPSSSPRSTGDLGELLKANLKAHVVELIGLNSSSQSTNPEYFRGQIDLAVELLSGDEDTEDLRAELMALISEN